MIFVDGCFAAECIVCNDGDAVFVFFFWLASNVEKWGGKHLFVLLVFAFTKQ